MSLSTPQQVQARLESIEADLALRQNEIEPAAMAWFTSKRDRELAEAVAYAGAKGPATERKIIADAAGAEVGAEEEGKWEGMKHVIRVLETRANIGMALLKSHGRAGG